MNSEVYYNRHKKAFSVRKKGKVFLHTDNVVLWQPKFVVQPAGRERVRREKKKNVHAFLRGKHVGCLLDFTEGFSRAYYNPYICEFFEDLESGQELKEAEYAWMTIADGLPQVWYKQKEK